MRTGCHPITGLNPGDTIRFRWQFSSDRGRGARRLLPRRHCRGHEHPVCPNVWRPDTCAGQSDWTSCNDGARAPPSQKLHTGRHVPRRGSALGCDDTVNDCNRRRPGNPASVDASHTNTIPPPAMTGTAAPVGDVCGAGICGAGLSIRASGAAPRTPDSRARRRSNRDAQPNSPTCDVARRL